MRFLHLFLALTAVIALSGCAMFSKEAKAPEPEATTPAQTEQDQTTPAVAEQPVPPKTREGEVVVFGRIQMVEYVNKISMQAPDSSGKVFLSDESGEKTYEIATSKAGDFGVNLAPGQYRLFKAEIKGYHLALDIALKVPEGHEAIYAGTVTVDGTPSGVEPVSGSSKFVFSVTDEYKDFIIEAKKTKPEVEELIAKSMFTPRGGIATGSYPNRVKRAKDLKNYLEGQSNALEEVATGVVVVIPYIANPLWLLTLPVR